MEWPCVRTERKSFRTASLFAFDPYGKSRLLTNGHWLAIPRVPKIASSSRTLCDNLVFAGQNSESLLKPPSKMGHVGEPPAICDFADGSMSLIRIFKGVSVARKPPRLNETHDGRIVICKNGVGISHAD